MYIYQRKKEESIEAYISDLKEGYVDLYIEAHLLSDLALALEKDKSENCQIAYAKALLLKEGIPQDTALGYKIIYPYVQKMNPYALWVLGKYYQIKKEEEKMLTYFSSASQLDFALASYDYALCLLKNKNPQDEKKAEHLLLMAGKDQLSLAQFALGKLNQERKDFYQALFWFETCASSSSFPLACYEVGRAYEEGKGTRKDIEKAKKYYLLGKEEPICACRYGLLMKEEDPLKAIEFLKYAKENGIQESYAPLGNLLLKENVEEALSCFKEGIDKKDIDSIYSLALYYEQNERVEEKEKAVSLLEEAILLGKEEAREKLFALKREIKEIKLQEEKIKNETPEEKATRLYLEAQVCKDEKTAFTMYEESASLGKEEALLYLASYYTKPQTENIECALSYYQKAIDKGSKKAQEDVSFLQEKLRKEKRCVYCGAPLKRKWIFFHVCPKGHKQK